MTANLAAVTSAATIYGDERAADQKSVDDVKLNAANAANTKLKNDYDSLSAEYEAYKMSHPDVTPPPVPVPTGTLLGSSLNGPAFKPTPGGLGYKNTTIARIYLRNLPAGSTWTDIKGDGTATSDLKDAVAKATEVIWLSCKETNPALVEAFLKTMPTNLAQEVWWTHHHEPENDAGYTPAMFVSEQKVMSPIARRYRAKFSTILMRYTFSPASGRDWTAYFPASLTPYVDIFGCDSYNTANKKGSYSNPADQIAPIKAAADARGLPWAIGETGASIFGAPAIRAKWAADLAAEAARTKGLAVAWWDQDVYAFDPPTALAWLGKP